MGRIYRDIKAISIPENAYINHSDGRVFLMTGSGRKKPRTVIGRLTIDNQMIPNNNFKELYPEKWKDLYNENVLKYEINIGVFGTVLGISTRNGVYPAVQKIYGYEIGNAIMDYCAYCLNYRTSTAQLFSESMANQYLFTRRRMSDSSLSRLFNTDMSEDKNHQFKIWWANHCSELGINHVWLSIDGSNNPFESSSSDLSEKGYAKNKSHRNIVSFIWAINVADGTPVTYFINRGGCIDSIAIKEMIAFLGQTNIIVDGVILDRLFCTNDVIKNLKIWDMQYIIMMQSTTTGHVLMLEQYAEIIRNNMDYLVSFKGIYGVVDTKRIFKNSSETGYVNLFYDIRSGANSSYALLEKIGDEFNRVNKELTKGYEPEIDSKLTQYIDISNQNGVKTAVLNVKAIQKKINFKGFFSMVSSSDFGLKFVYDIYRSRDVSEKEYSIIKSQIGFKATNTPSQICMKNRYAVAFLSAIIRNEIMNASKDLKLSTNLAIKELNLISLKRMPNDNFMFVNNLSKRQKNLMDKFDLQTSDFEKFAEDLNLQISNSVEIQTHMLSQDQRRIDAKPKRGRPRKERSEDEIKVVRSRGRPKGSKNKKTLKKEKNQMRNEPPIKRKPGRPKGSKNKPKSETVKRKPGRPKGSKNKPKT